jgi:hypothetical protein
MSFVRGGGGGGGGHSSLATVLVKRPTRHAFTHSHQADVLINNGVAVSPGDITTCSFDAFHMTQKNNAGLFVLGRHLRGAPPPPPPITALTRVNTATNTLHSPD